MNIYTIIKKIELLNETDYGARYYDAEIAKWKSIDPLAEDNEHYTPYSYGLNNPIRYIDPNGMNSEDDAFNSWLSGFPNDVVNNDKDNISNKVINSTANTSSTGAKSAVSSANVGNVNKDGPGPGPDANVIKDANDLYVLNVSDHKSNPLANQGDPSPQNSQGDIQGNQSGPGPRQPSQLPQIKPAANGKFPSVQYKKDSRGRTYYVDRIGMVHYVSQGLLAKSVETIPSKLSTWGGVGWSVMKGGWLGFAGGLGFGIMDNVQTDWWDNYVNKTGSWMGTDGKEH